MSVNMNVCIGPYLTLPKVDYQDTSEKYCCANIDCKNHDGLNSSHTFCPLCGALGEEKTVVKTVHGVPSYYDLAESWELDPYMFSDQNGTLIPNMNSNGLFKSFYDRSNPDSIQIDSTDIVACINFLKENGKEFLDKFKEQYGIQLEVKYGVVYYYN